MLVGLAEHKRCFNVDVNQELPKIEFGQTFLFNQIEVFGAIE